MDEIGAANRSSADCLRFVHTADLHIGSAFCGLSAADEALSTLLSKATYAAFENIVQLCIERKVDFLLISGDVYDSSDQCIYEPLKFLKSLTRLADASIPVYLAFGNHDPKKAWSTNVKWPHNVRIMSPRKPDVFFCENQKAVIVGMSYQIASIKENLAKGFPLKQNQWPFTIGMLHCNLGQSGHLPYAPCTLADLTASKYDYWALGHIHKPQIVQKDLPTVIYPGNPQGRDVGESGPRGCYFVTVTADNRVEAEFIETSVVRWTDQQVNTEGVDDLNALEELLARVLEQVRSATKLTICRLTLTGRGRVHEDLTPEGATEELRHFFRDAEEARQDAVFIERIINKTEPPIDREQVKKRDDLVGDIINISDSLVSNESANEISRVLTDLFEDSTAKSYIDPIEQDELKELIHEAEVHLLDMLVGSPK